jgi:hypothetical protein
VLARRPSTIPRVRIRYLTNTDICLRYNAVNFLMGVGTTVEYVDLSSITCMFDSFYYFTVLSLIFMDIHFRDFSARGEGSF